ncbi:hypothetical protein [Candidatus Chloroploca sp. Khr17]|uniref:hypothetical protein n=1 Tax=Candidatus Chloroploca sp. Khr17 TaxID=2496869 RepID=UPI00101C2D3C|nr:hypothetical protein [Candidatus Chloroploca sp. Khr17]
MNKPATPTYLHYTLRLRSPAILTMFAGDPNSAATKAFIPGSTLRGLVAARLLANGFADHSDEFWRLILSGEVRYLHAYPELGGARSMPLPVAWKRTKDADDDVVDLAGFSGETTPLVVDDDDDAVWPKVALVSCAESFMSASVSSGTWLVATPTIGSRLHQQRDRVKGRPWKDSSAPNAQSQGTIFAYEYLEAEQVFSGTIQLQPEVQNDLGLLKQLLTSSPIFFGRSRRAGYGGDAELVFTGQGDREYEHVTGRLQTDLLTETSFRVLLTSAYLGRHPITGQFDPSALGDELCRQLDGAATVERMRCAFTTVGGFNRKWRLHLPEAQAVAAGTVLVLRATAPISVAKLRMLEHDGLGERRSEGFGRLVFLEAPNQLHMRLRSHDAHADPHPRDEGAVVLTGMAPEQRQHLDALEARIVLAAARAELDRVAAELAAKAKQRPTTSLLGRLRTLFRPVVDEQTAAEALTRLAQWCDDDDRHALKKPARSQLDRCAMTSQNLRSWLVQLAQADHGTPGWTALLHAAGDQTTLTRLALQHHLTQREAAEAIVHGHAALLRVYLIDALLVTLARLNRGDMQ